MKNNTINEVSVLLDQNVYNAFRNLQYKYWYAIAEFVDNSIQSYLDNKQELDSLYKVEKTTFNIKIDIDSNSIRIFDNAGGISLQNFQKAFKPGRIPENREGLNEFGMGMKVAAVWLSDLYSVKSVALNENVERTIQFDRIKVTQNSLKSVEVRNKIINTSTHYTEIYLTRLNHDNAPTHHKQIEKLKNHLTDIYRDFIRNKTISIFINDEQLYFNEPHILIAKEQDSQQREKGELKKWKLDVDLSLSNGRRIHGFLALLDKMDQKHNGLSLFRRGRVIQGSHDEKYFPSYLFGQPGSSLYRLLFGELHLEKFDVSFNKGSFTNTADLDLILQMIREECLPLLSQGRNYRKKNDSSKNFNENDNPAKNKFISKTIENIENKTNFAFTSNSNNSKIESTDYYSTEQNENIVPIDKFKDFTLKDKSQNDVFVKVLIIRDQSDSRIYKIRKSEEDSIGYTAHINISHKYFENFDFKKNLMGFEATLELLTIVVLADIQNTVNQHDSTNFRFNFNTYLAEYHGNNQIP
jgi:hypothetical protein